VKPCARLSSPCPFFSVRTLRAKQKFMAVNGEPNPFPITFMLIGFVLVTAGVWWIYRPAALVAAGLILMGLAFIGRGGAL